MANRFPAGLMALAFCFIIALPAYAQDTPTPEKKALIKELMKLLKASTDADAVAEQFLELSLKDSGPVISQGLLREIAQQKQSQELSLAEQIRLKSEADEAAQRILVRIRTEYPKRVNFGELLDRIGLEMYGKHFTEEELKELIALNKSPVAQKFLRLLPQITAETLPKLEAWLTPIITQLVSEIIADEKKKLITR